MSDKHRQLFDARYAPDAFGSVGITREMLFEIYSHGANDATIEAEKQKDELSLLMSKYVE